MFKKTQLAAIEATQPEETLKPVVKEIAIPMPVEEKEKSKEKPVNKNKLWLTAKFLSLFSKNKTTNKDVKYIPSHPLAYQDFMTELLPYLNFDGMLSLMGVNTKFLKLIALDKANANVTINNPFFYNQEEPTSQPITLPFIEARKLLIQRGQIISAIDELISKIDAAVNTVAHLNDNYNACCGLECCYCPCKTSCDEDDEDGLNKCCGGLYCGLSCIAWIGVVVMLAYLSATTPDKKVYNDSDTCGTINNPHRANCTVPDDYQLPAGLVGGLGIFAVPVVAIILLGITLITLKCATAIIDKCCDLAVSRNNTKYVGKKHWNAVLQSLRELYGELNKSKDLFSPEIAKSVQISLVHINSLNHKVLGLSNLRQDMRTLRSNLVTLKTQLQRPKNVSHHSVFAQQTGPHTIIKMQKEIEFKSDRAEKIARKLK